MALRVLSRFRPPSPGRWAWLGRFGDLALLGALLGLGVALWVAPTAWGAAHHKLLLERFNDAVTQEPVQLLAALERLPKPGPGFPEDPAAARVLLDAHPLLVGALRWELGPVWVRKGGGLVPETDTERSRQWRTWAKEARPYLAEGRYDPALPSAEPPVFLFLSEAWIWVIRWDPGTPEVEQLLRQALGQSPLVRVGLARIGQPSRTIPAQQVPVVYRPPNVQTTLDCPEAPWTVVWTGTMTGPAWQFIFHPWPAQARAWDREVAGRTWSARILGLVILSLLALGLLGRRQRAQRKRLEADRLAALAHSLKTPLAIHKLRCDTLRMGHLDAARQNEELMRLGQEVDDLTRLIERGLLSLSAGGASHVLDPLGAAWVEDLAEAFRPALEAAGRTLETELAEATILAHGPALAPCLSTLLENAVHHGAGTVRLSTRVEGGVVRLAVRDEGPGLDAESLGALGRAFQRLRQQGEEGFRHEGQGLGLYLLAEVAGQEGWGFTLESAPGQGFSAKMDLPLAAP